jgi:hypothetical protein
MEGAPRHPDAAGDHMTMDLGVLSFSKRREGS